MSPPVIAPQPTLDNSNSDCPYSTESLKCTESLNFSVGSPYTAGFNCSRTGDDKSHVSSRSRPRLMKMRKREMPASQVGKTVKTDLGLNVSSDVSGEKDGKLGSIFGVNNRNSGSNGSGLGFGISVSDSLFGLGSGSGKSFFDSSMNSSTSKSQLKQGDDKANVQKKSGSFVFGVCEDGPMMNQNLPDEGFTYGPYKNGLQMDANLRSRQFVFGVDESASRVQLDQQDLNNPGLGLNVDELGKSNSVNFVFGANEKASSTSDLDPEKQYSGVKADKSEADKVSGNTISDVRDNGKENVEIGSQPQNACHNDCFVFGGLKYKGGFNGGSTKPFSEMNQSNRVNADDRNCFGQDSHNSFSDIKSNFRDSGSSGDSIEKDPAFSVSNEMKKLNISDSEVDAKKPGKFTGNCVVNSNNVFVFGGSQKNSDTVNEHHPTMSHKTLDASCFSRNTSESNRSSSILFPSAGISVGLNAGFFEAPPMNKDEDNISFRGKLAGLDSSEVDYSTPKMKFDFSNNNLYPGMDKVGSANLKSLGGKRSKKRNGKLRQKTVVQQLFSQNCVSKEGINEQSHKSPGGGSPMDFSPYQDTSASNAPESDTGTGDKGEFFRNEKHASGYCEERHDNMSTLNFRPLPGQDGLSAVRHQHKKKYKLKVGSSQTAQRNNPNKENAKQEPSGTTIHEVCEHWRIRGNEAYHAKQLSKAEQFYSMGISSAPHVSTVGYSLKPLLLCYSNRAATRMSLGRMREAIRDCTKASELDTDFLKVILRAGNCYLVLGEVEDAIQCYNRCLSARAGICLDRRVTIEAAEGQEKAKKVAECILQSANVLQEGTDDAASSALGIIEEALSISRYSERLLEMKGEALYMLRMYDEVIQLCAQTLDIAEKNFSADNSKHGKLWRWHLQTKSHYRLGRLDLALDLTEKQENLSISSNSGDIIQESSITLAANIRELLSLKKSGNEAFNSGRHTEAIENYTAAISKSFESRGFMAICFCNRAAAYQALSQIVDAISDCSVAIALDENYLKAISRRATLHEMIRDYKQAVSDLEKLVSLLESQSQVKTQGKSSGGSVRDLRKAHRRLSSVEEKAKKEIPLDLYLILGIKASDAESEIKKAYRKAALRHHPDKAGQVLVRSDVGDDGTLWKEYGEKIHNDADRLFKVIGEAYAILSDPNKRSKYDMEEEMRSIYRDSNRNSNSGHPSTSYTAAYERGSWRQGGFSTSSERNSSSRRYWYEARSYSNSNSRW